MSKLNPLSIHSDYCAVQKQDVTYKLAFVKTDTAVNGNVKDISTCTASDGTTMHGGDVTCPGHKKTGCIMGFGTYLPGFNSFQK